MTGDGARRDADGDYWIIGRIDDVMNVSGHRLGTAEVESALVLHDAVAEAAVVGTPHPIKGEAIYAFVNLMAGEESSDDLRGELTKLVRSEIGPIASPEVIQFVSGLPKTRSGKIMRRILRKVAADDVDELGDTSTLADPAVVGEIVAGAEGVVGPGGGCWWVLGALPAAASRGGPSPPVGGTTGRGLNSVTFGKSFFCVGGVD